MSVSFEDKSTTEVRENKIAKYKNSSYGCNEHVSSLQIVE